MGRKSLGDLLVIGGHEDKNEDRILLRETVAMANSRSGKLVVMTVAAGDQRKTGEDYRQIFSELTAGNIEVVVIENRIDAGDENICRQIENAGCIFFTGGDQLRITSILGGSPAHKSLRRAFEEGAAIAGTSAGAAVMSGSMIVGGGSMDAPRSDTLNMATGLGLLEEVIVDQHFAQRGRIGRLLYCIAQNPNILGIGIDENTGVRIYPDGHFQVLGQNSVTVLDGTQLRCSNVSELSEKQALSLEGMLLHMLSGGYGFDLDKRQVISPPQTQ